MTNEFNIKIKMNRFYCCFFIIEKKKVMMIKQKQTCCYLYSVQKLSLHYYLEIRFISNLNKRNQKQKTQLNLSLSLKRRLTFRRMFKLVLILGLAFCMANAKPNPLVCDIDTIRKN